MINRFRRAKDKEDIFKQLVTGEDAPFATFKDVFMLAVCIGFNNQKRFELPPGGEQIHWTVLDSATDQIMINAIALCEEGDLYVLMDTDYATDKKFPLIEQYASAGMDVLKTILLDTPGNPLDNLVDLIFAQEEKEDYQNNRALLEKIDIVL